MKEVELSACFEKLKYTAAILYVTWRRS